MATLEDVQFFGLTDVGRRRSNNEDSLLLDEDLGLVIVADGMGGHHDGATASQMAIDTIHQELLKHRDMIDGLADADGRSDLSFTQLLGLLEYGVQKASARIYEHSNEESGGKRMGTTVSLLLVLGATACVAHVGDSRIFLMREDTVYQVTNDHTVGEEMKKLGLSAEAVAKMPTRNSLTRAVGTYAHLKVDTMSFELLPGDELLVTSDGLHGYFDSPQELLPFLHADDGERAVESLVAFANKQGGRDNISAAMVQVGLMEVDELSMSQRIAIKQDLVGVLPLFANLNEREILSVLQLIAIEPFRPGEVVVRQGEPVDRMYTVLSGKLKVICDNEEIGSIGPGDHLGELALVKRVTHPVTVQAVDPSELVSLNRDSFFEMVRYKPELGIKLLWQLLNVVTQRLEETVETLSHARQSVMIAGLGKASQPAVVEDPFLETAERPGRSSIYVLDE